MKTVIVTLAAMAATLSLCTAAPAAEALPVAVADVVDARASSELFIPLVATLVEDVTIADLVTANPANSTISKRANGSFQAFSGDRCDGGVGGQIGISNGPQCIDTQGRHSYAILGCVAEVVYFELPGCRGRYSSQRVNQGCYNVNTGYYWDSASVACVN